MLIRDAIKGRRVVLADLSRYDPLIPRVEGTLTSGRVKASSPPYEEGLYVRVKWDGLTTPEYWHLTDLRV